MGITFKNESIFIPLSANFIFNNDTQSDLRIINGALTSGIFSYDGGIDQTFRQFTDDLNPFPFLLNPTNSSDTVIVQYLYDEAVFETEDKNQCLYVAGMIDDDENLVIQDTFFITARKTNKYVGAYEKEINFDSVYIGNQYNITKNWYVRNVWTTNQRIFNDNYKLISSQLTSPEIILDRLEDDKTLAPDRESINWKINYSPIDTKLDEAIYKLYFYPFESEGNTEVIDSVQTKISGVGVEQKIRVVSVLTEQFLTQNDGEYTIDLGELRPKELDTISVVIENIGNFPIGYKNEELINNRNDKLIILDGLNQVKNLIPTLTDTIAIEFTAGSGGQINFKYEFESDLLDRKISGAQRKNSLFHLNFIGTVKQPIIITNRDSIDFGTVTISNENDCENSVSENIVLKNIGNEELEIFNIIVEDTQNFTASFSKSKLQTSDTGSVFVTYEPNTQGIHNSKLLIISNASKPSDTTLVFLTGKGIPRTGFEIKLDSSKSFPGTQVLIPILVDKNKIANAKNYSDELRYNRTLLEFVEPIFNNTASSAPSIDTEFKLNNNGNLEIKLKRQSEMDFLESDTLVLLKFNTFLGNDDHSYIDFTNTKIGNNNCDQIFEIQPQRGIYETDSVCGLEFKTYGDFGGVTIQSVSPNPINDYVKIEIYSPVEMNLDVKLINMIGEKKYEIRNYMAKQGVNTLNFNFESLTNGVYNLLLTKNRTITNKIILINR